MGGEKTMGQKVVEQGPFGQIKLYFGLECRPEETSWEDQIVFWARKSTGFWANKIVILARISSRQGLLGRLNRILRQKADPQGPFGETGNTANKHTKSKKEILLKNCP